MSIVRHKTFGKTHKPTIYYLVGYGGTIRRYLAHVRALVLSGFRVVIFEYDKSILDAGDPDLLLSALHDISKTIKRDKKEHIVAGVYGVSLGSWLGSNVLVECNIRSGMFNTGAVNLVRVIWENPRFSAVKHKFQKHGYTRKSLEKILGPYEFTPDGRRWQGKQILIMSSAGDRVLDINEVQHNVRSWKNGGDDVELFVTKHLDHGPVIARNMFRVPRTRKFFKQS